MKKKIAYLTLIDPFFNAFAYKSNTFWKFCSTWWKPCSQIYPNICNAFVLSISFCDSNNLNAHGTNSFHGSKCANVAPNSVIQSTTWLRTSDLVSSRPHTNKVSFITF